MGRTTPQQPNVQRYPKFLCLSDLVVHPRLRPAETLCGTLPTPSNGPWAWKKITDVHLLGTFAWCRCASPLFVSCSCRAILSVTRTGVTVARMRLPAGIARIGTNLNFCVWNWLYIVCEFEWVLYMFSSFLKCDVPHRTFKTYKYFPKSNQKPRKKKTQNQIISVC